MSNLSEAYAADRTEAETRVFASGGVDMMCTGCRDWCTRPTSDAGTKHTPCVVWNDGHPESCHPPGVWEPLNRPCWFYRLEFEDGAEYVKEFPVTTKEPVGDYQSTYFWRSDKRLSDDEITEWFGYLRLGGEIACRRDDTPYRRTIARIERFPDPPASLCEEYVLEDYTDDEDDIRWVGIKRADRDDRAESWSTATVTHRSPQFHAIPDGPPEEIAQILKAAEHGYPESFKRIAIAHEPGDVVVVWSQRNAHDGELSDFLRMPRARLIELLRGWLRPEELLP